MPRMEGAVGTPDLYVNPDLDVDPDNLLPDMKQKYDNALLCYIVNKMDILNHDLIVKITSEFYTDSEVEIAKDLLFKLVPGMRNIKRKGHEKRTQNIVDMLTLLHKANPEDIPLFGIFDLSRLPPMDLNYVDVTTMTKDIKQIRTDMKDYEAQVKQIRIENINKDISSMKDNMNQMGNQLAEVLRLLVSSEPTKNKFNTMMPSDMKLPPSVHRMTPRSSRKLPRTPPLVTCEDGPGARPKVTSLQDPAPVRDYSQALLKPPKLLQPRQVSRDESLGVKDSDGGAPFKVVSYRRRQNQNMVVGKAKVKGKGLGGRGRFVSLFVSRFEPDVETEKVKQYVNGTFDVSFECEKLKTRYNSYASFNIYGYCSDTSKFYSAENWPENILVRRFYKASQPNVNDNGGD